MKTTSVVTLMLGAFILAGCNDSKRIELEKDVADMQTETSLLRQDLTARDKYIDEIMRSVNQVYTSLERSKSKEVSLFNKTRDIEGPRRLNSGDIRKAVLEQIAAITSDLKQNRRQISGLQQKLHNSEIRYASLDEMVQSLNVSLLDREQSIASLEDQVKNLQGTVAEKSRLIGEKESLLGERENEIEEQKNRLNTVYYIVGTMDELKEKGIITKEGGILWGLLGSTTVLSNAVDPNEFTQLDQTKIPAIQIQGKVVDIIPKRNEESFAVDQPDGSKGYLMIKRPDKFWRQKYLVVIVD